MRKAACLDSVKVGKSYKVYSINLEDQGVENVKDGKLES